MAARPKLNILSGAAIPAGPMKLGLPKGGPRPHPAAGPGPRPDHRSKKAYTGTVAGLGRSPSGVRLQSGPKGPGAHAFHATATTLPDRAKGPAVAAAVRFRPAGPRKPSLMNRIGERLRRSAAAFGL